MQKQFVQTQSLDVPVQSYDTELPKEILVIYFSFLFKIEFSKSIFWNFLVVLFFFVELTVEELMNKVYIETELKFIWSTFSSK